MRSFQPPYRPALSHLASALTLAWALALPARAAEPSLAPPKGVAAGTVEIKRRATGEKHEASIESVLAGLLK